MGISSWITRRPASVGNQPIRKTEPADSLRPTPHTQYSSDQPIRSRANDQFNRSPFARRIAEILVRRADPSSLVVGIYGPWGDGKTSTLNLLEEALSEHENSVPFAFNPWHFTTEESLLRGFFTSLGEKLGRSLKTKSEQIAPALKKYGTLLSAASVGAVGFQVSPGRALKELGDQLSVIELDELRGRVERVLREAGKRIVVLIDDIDRLDRNEIHAIFKLVKLSAGFEFTSYVLAFDDEIVAAALGERYGGGDTEAGRKFVEKIIQVPLHLPPPDDAALGRLINEGINTALAVANIELPTGDAEKFGYNFSTGVMPYLSTPRQAKLYANALMFALPLLRGEVHPIDQMLIEAIRVFFPSLYAAIRQHPGSFLAVMGERMESEQKKSIAELINKALATDKVDEPDRVKERLLPILFPRLKGVFGNMYYGPEWDQKWASEQRICSQNYFPRYFAYGVPPGDVPDIALREFVRTISVTPEPEIDERIRAFSASYGISKFIEKLRRQESTLSDDASVVKTLSCAVARNGNLFPRGSPMAIFSSPFLQAGILVGQLVRGLKTRALREDVAANVIKTAQGIGFAAECFRWLLPMKDEPQDGNDRIISLDCERRLGELLAERIQSRANDTPIYRESPADAGLVLALWKQYGSDGEVSRYLADRFTTNNTELDEFLGAFAGRAWELETGAPLEGSLHRHSYDGLTALISADSIMEHLRQRYPNLDQEPPMNAPLRARIAHQFARIYAADKARDVSATGPTISDSRDEH